MVDRSGLQWWSPLADRSQVLLAVARDPSASVAEVAKAAGMRERTAAQLLAELERLGYLHRLPSGWCVCLWR